MCYALAENFDVYASESLKSLSEQRPQVLVNSYFVQSKETLKTQQKAFSLLIIRFWVARLLRCMMQLHNVAELTHAVVMLVD